MTGFAPTLNADAVGASTGAVARSAVSREGSQRPSDFSAALAATGNTRQAAPQTVKAETPDQAVSGSQTNSDRSQKASTRPANPGRQISSPHANANVAPSAPAMPAAVATTLSPLTTGVSPTATAAPGFSPAGSAASDNANIAASSGAVSSALVQVVNSADSTQAAVISTVDESEGNISSPSQAGAVATSGFVVANAATTHSGTLEGLAIGAGLSSATQFTEDTGESAEMSAESEVAAMITSATGPVAAGKNSQANPSEGGSSSATATSATTSVAKDATTPESIAKLEMAQTGLIGQSSVAPQKIVAQQGPAPAAAPAAFDNRDGRTAPQPATSATVQANATAASAGLQKAFSDAHDKLVQQIGARLQAEIVAEPTKAISGANASNGGSGNLPEQNLQNPSFNSNMQNSLKQSDDVATGIALDQSEDSGDDAETIAGNSGAAAMKAAGLLASANEPAVRILQDASQQAAGMAAPPATSQPATTSSATPSRPDAPPQSLPQSLPPSLNDVMKASEMYQRVGGSEMHVAMETDLLGAVDLRAAMHQSALTATIGVQRADVQALLSNELPALQHALAEKNFHVDQISVLNNSVGDRAGSHGQQETPARNPFAPRAELTPGVAASGTKDTEDQRPSSVRPPTERGWSNERGRISVHV
jgi:Flagellar hook-length control protein FliK